MKPARFFTSLGFILVTGAASSAQNFTKVTPDLPRGPGDKPKAEVSVVLDDVGIPLVPDDEAAKDGAPAKGPAAAKEAPAPKAQPAVEKVAEPPVRLANKLEEPAVAAPPVDPGEPAEKGISVHVEKIQGGNGPIDPRKVTLSFPFPPKPLTTAPPGWAFDPNAGAEPIFKDAELGAGSKITLKIVPHVLVPVADGKDSYSVNEPGYDPALGLRQNATVGTILATSIAQLDDDSLRLGNAIDRLEQLVSSLPAPDPEPEAAPVAPVVPPAALQVKDPTPPKKPR